MSDPTPPGPDLSNSSGSAGPAPAGRPGPVEVTSCPCGVAVRQPWRTRDALYSPASFIGGLIWLALGVGAALGGFNPFGWILLAVLGLLVLGSLVLQAAKRHRGMCWLGRGVWFGIALPGLPLRVTFWFSF